MSLDSKELHYFHIASWISVCLLSAIFIRLPDWTLLSTRDARPEIPSTLESRSSMILESIEFIEGLTRLGILDRPVKSDGRGSF